MTKTLPYNDLPPADLVAALWAVLILTPRFDCLADDIRYSKQYRSTIAGIIHGFLGWKLHAFLPPRVYFFHADASVLTVMDNDSHKLWQEDMDI